MYNIQGSDEFGDEWHWLQDQRKLLKGCYTRELEQLGSKLGKQSEIKEDMFVGDQKIVLEDTQI